MYITGCSFVTYNAMQQATVPTYVGRYAVYFIFTLQHSIYLLLCSSTNPEMPPQGKLPRIMHPIHIPTSLPTQLQGR